MEIESDHSNDNCKGNLGCLVLFCVRLMLLLLMMMALIMVLQGRENGRMAAPADGFASCPPCPPPPPPPPRADCPSLNL